MKSRLKNKMLTKAISLLASTLIMTGAITANMPKPLEYESNIGTAREVISINGESVKPELRLVSEEHYIDENGSSIVDRLYESEPYVTATRGVSGTMKDWRAERTIDDNVNLWVKGTFTYSEGNGADSATVTNVSGGHSGTNATFSSVSTTSANNQGTHLPPVLRKYAYAQHSFMVKNFMGITNPLTIRVQVNTAGKTKTSY